MSIMKPREKNDDAMEVPDFSDYTDKDWPERQKKYAAISQMDVDIGGLFAKLKALGMTTTLWYFFK